ncbi:MAG: hypothetical protein AB7J28_01055 [Hyphomonadaceae bacterium]
MAEEVRQTDVARDPEGRVVGTTERIVERRRGGGFGWGLLFGVLIIAVGIVVFAYSQGGFTRTERVVTDTSITRNIETAAENTGEAIEGAAQATGDAIDNAGASAEQAANNAADEVQSN